MFSHKPFFMPQTEVFEIPIVFTEDTNGLAKAAAEIAKVQQAAKQMQDSQNAAFKGGAEAVNEFAEGVTSAGNEIAAYDAAVKKAEGDQKRLRDVLKDSAKSINIFGVNIGDTIDKFKEKRAMLQTIIAGLRGTTGALKIFRLALISTGIGAIVVALGSLAALFFKNQKAIDKVSQVMAGLGAVIDVIIDRAAVLGSAIVKLFSGDFVGAANEAKAAVSGLNDELTREFQLAQQIEEQLQKLHKQEILLNIEREASRAKIKELNLLAEDTTKSEGQRVKAAREAIAIEQTLLNKQIENQKGRIAAALGQTEFTKETEKQLARIASGAATADEVISGLGLSTSTVADLEEFESLVTEFFRTQQGSLELQTTLNNKLNTIQKEGAARRKQALEEERRRLEALQKELDGITKTLRDQIEAGEQAGMTDIERLQRQKEIALQELETTEQVAVERAKQLRKSEQEITAMRNDFAKLRGLIEKTTEEEITAIVREQNAKREEAEEKRREKLAADTQKALARLNEVLDRNAQIETLRLDLIQESGDKELSLEQFKEKRKLEIQRDALVKKRANLIAFGLSENSLEVRALDAQLGQINNSLSAFAALPIFERLRNQFKNLFKLDDQQMAEIGQQLSGALGNIFDGLSSIYEAELTQQDKLIDKQRERVSELEKSLNDELKLKEQGLANDSDLLQKQLEAQTEILKKEEEKRLEIEKKAAKLRLRQEALQTASNIALSVAKVISAESSKGLLGVVTAIAGVASIFALMAKAKAQAAQFANPEKLRKGAKLKGKTHEQGGVPLLADGNLYEAEAGEWLVGTAPSREHDSFIERLNNGEFQGEDLNRHVNFSRDFFNDPKNMIASLAPEYGVPVLPDYLANAIPKLRETTAASREAKAANEKAVMVEVFAEMFGRMQGGIGSVERAIREQPLAIPITPDGYIIKDKQGNTENVRVYAAPKRRG